MKRRVSTHNWLLLAASALLLIVRPQGCVAQLSLDEADFLGFRPGWHTDSLPATKSQGKYQKLDRAVPLVNDSLTYEGIPLKSVVLFFHKGKLHSIDIRLTGANAHTMLSLVEALYGEGERKDNFGYQREWRTAKNVLYYEENMISHDGLFSFISIKVMDNYSKWLEYYTAPK
jgi:hypothetical protein